MGDGLNDCAALAGAHVGIVVQTLGAQATVDAASGMLQGDLGQLTAAVVVCRRASALISMNLVLAFIFNAAVIFAALTLKLPLWAGVLADNSGLLIVLANSIWPLTW